MQRMQLQMTAPLDIGLEQSDAVLGHGQEDIFDLEYAEQIPTRKGLYDVADTDDEDEGPKESKDDNTLNDEALDTDGEQNGRMRALEDDLDGLYETYRERLAERDTKFKVREARQNDRRREEWSGIDRNEPQTDSDEGDECGGWNEMEQRKARIDESESSSTGEEEITPSPQLSKRKLPQQETSRKKIRLLSSLEEPQSVSQMSRKANVWFSQDLFNGLDPLGENDDGVSDSPHPLPDVEVRPYPCQRFNAHATIRRLYRKTMTWSHRPTSRLYHKNQTTQRCGMPTTPMKTS
jgi:AdoMet-dependent rRNA methyltransferase SPB1